MDISTDYIIVKKKKCSSCGEPVSNVHNTYCKPCKARYMRERYKDPEEQKKQRARQTANQMVIKGLMKKECCKVCGSPETEKHHLNYDEPCNVIWLCVPCHTNVHKMENNVFSSEHS